MQTRIGRLETVEHTGELHAGLGPAVREQLERSVVLALETVETRELRLRDGLLAAACRGSEVAQRRGVLVETAVRVRCGRITEDLHTLRDLGPQRIFVRVADRRHDPVARLVAVDATARTEREHRRSDRT